ncbi:sporulation-delaying protein SdpB family protein [Bacillus mycoides]|uniref:sporulation-delaying protein SdpB family protein n=1 Tax=Bacillus mycoides TaxID=1405 RepID=UPI0003E227B8|nr:sporulation-delaying protein SdpB family protein [Bacillus mycoides]ETT84687.1 hypothetical protein C174_02324 [Bacillus mycoides FSL H7-687]
MLEKLNSKVVSWSKDSWPWTNVYGLARTIMALSTALTLAFNKAEILFKPAVGVTEYPSCSGNISIFCIAPSTYFWLNIIRWICVFILIVVASGWRPQITAPFHWWISYSLQVSALTIDGGEQVAAVFSMLILPIALTDTRKSHWGRTNEIEKSGNLYTRLIALLSYHAIRIQVAILYFNSTTAKLNQGEWIDGTAVYYYLQEHMLGLNPVLMDIFQPILSTWLIVIPTWGTLIVQSILITALFAPKKYWKTIFLIAIFMHEIFAIMLGLISFSMIMISVLILYLRPFEKEFQFKFLVSKKNKIKKDTFKEVV